MRGAAEVAHDGGQGGADDRLVHGGQEHDHQQGGVDRPEAAVGVEVASHLGRLRVSALRRGYRLSHKSCLCVLKGRNGLRNLELSRWPADRGGAAERLGLDGTGRDRMVPNGAASQWPVTGRRLPAGCPMSGYWEVGAMISPMAAVTARTASARLRIGSDCSPTDTVAGS